MARRKGQSRKVREVTIEICEGVCSMNNFYVGKSYIGNVDQNTTRVNEVSPGYFCFILAWGGEIWT